jgi:hypothetical protein
MRQVVSQIFASAQVTAWRAYRTGRFTVSAYSSAIEMPSEDLKAMKRELVE